MKDWLSFRIMKIGLAVLEKNYVRDRPFLSKNWEFQPVGRFSWGFGAPSKRTIIWVWTTDRVRYRPVCSRWSPLKTRTHCIRNVWRFEHPQESRPLFHKNLWKFRVGGIQKDWLHNKLLMIFIQIHLLGCTDYLRVIFFHFQVSVSSPNLLCFSTFLAFVF